jgi:hypothetical protein
MKTRYAALAAMTGMSIVGLEGAAKGSAQEFAFTTIDYPKAVSTHLGGIAHDGKVVGFYFDDAGTAHGFLRSPEGTFTPPIDYVNASVTVAGTFLHRIDSTGQTVAGFWMDGAGMQHGLVIELSSNTAVSFDFPPQGVTTGTIVNGISSSGEISGAYCDSAGVEHGFTASLNLSLAQATGFKSINFPGALLTELEGVNDSGDILGAYLAADGKIISFLSEGGITENCAKCTPLSSPSRPAVIARGINNLRQIVGFDENSIGFFASPMANGLRFGSSHGFLLTSPTAQAIPVDVPGVDAQFDGVGSINDSGMIAGQYNSPGSVTHGFVAVPTD